MRRMPGSVYTLPVPAILSSQVLNTKVAKIVNRYYLSFDFLIIEIKKHNLLERQVKNFMQRGKIYRLKNNAILQKGRDEKQYKRCKNGNSILLLSIRENNDEYTVYAEIFEKEVKNSMKMTFDRKCYWVRFSEFITLSNNAVELTDHSCIIHMDLSEN